MLNAQDDFRHQTRPPYGRESLFYGIGLPDEKLQLIVYTWVSHDDKAGRLVTAFADGERRDFYTGVGDVDATGMDFDDWQVEGMTVRHVDPLQSAEISYHDDDADWDLRFDALHEPFSYSRNAMGCPPMLADDRFEQSGRVTGTIAFGDRRIEIDTIGHRDHSWGTRDWDAIQHHKWISAQAGAETTLNAMYVVIEGRLTVHGYVVRDGELSPIKAIDPIVEHDSEWWQRSGRFVIDDEADRRTLVEFDRCYAITPLKSGKATLLYECGAECSIDGRPGDLHMEMAWNRDYAESRRQAARQLAAAGA